MYWNIRIEVLNQGSGKLTPSDAESIEWRLGIESALSIFTITWISALQPTKNIHTLAMRMRGSKDVLKWEYNGQLIDIYKNVLFR